MNKSWIYGLVLGTVVACGGGAKSEAAKSAADEPAGSGANQSGGSSKGQDCIKLANTPRTPPDERPSKLELSHILVKHNGLKPSDAVDRTPEQACLLAQEAREALLGGDEWSAVVQKYSDSPGPTEGGLGSVSYDELEKPFADAAFSLGEGEVSHPVETKRGFHIIVHTP